jgi:hypothetical protein
MFSFVFPVGPPIPTGDLLFVPDPPGTRVELCAPARYEPPGDTPDYIAACADQTTDKR